MSARGRAERGYSLFLAAVVVALLALVLLSLARVQADLSPSLRSLRADAERERRAHSLLMRTTFLMLSEPIGPRSLIVGGPRDFEAAAMPMSRRQSFRELRLDGRFYAAGDGAFVSVQDENGLLNLNAGDEAALANLLVLAGASQRPAQHLAAALTDYVDHDDLVRPGGGEADAYRRARLPGPANQVFSTRWGAWDALGWRDGGAAFEPLWDNVTALPAGAAVNLNTAPSPVLEALLGDARRAAAVVEQREHAELRTQEDVEALTGVRTRAAGAGFATEPGAVFRVRVAFGRAGRGQGQAYESQLVLAEQGAERPFFWRAAGRITVSDGRQFEQVESLPRSVALPNP